MRIYPFFMENTKKSGNLLIAFLGILSKSLVPKENEKFMDCRKNKAEFTEAELKLN